MTKHESPRSYLINTGTNVLRRNSYDLRKSLTNREADIASGLDLNYNSNKDYNNRSSTSMGSGQNPSQSTDNEIENIENPLANSSPVPSSPVNHGSARPTRAVKLPPKYKDYVVY